MKEEIEIEYKQLLLESEYNKIKNDILKQEHKIIEHENFYFETKTKDLKKRKQALRIRVSQNYIEICLKTQRENDLLENNILISKNEFDSIYQDNTLIYNYDLDLPKGLYLIGSLKTNRIEHVIRDGLICLDMSTYNNKKDYEIEFEANDYNKEQAFINYLDSFAIKYKPNHKSKIQRFSEEIGL
ncbi:uncharacterized protein YjbK [Bacilli bacterium PM5-3]|nr:uncharacterized protein YjbK [Bacilli bacterium PM5-3]MDH6604340.1 uncharacterized protein YjbK [Bacilli bacterium PM5-9]